MNTASLKTVSCSHYQTYLLDDTVPLKGASHGDVVRYTVDIPTRYAECFAVLASGEKVPLMDKRQFVGWSGYDEKRSLLFESQDSRIEACIDPFDYIGRHSPGNIAGVDLQPLDRKPTKDCRQFIAIDGDVLTVPAV